MEEMRLVTLARTGNYESLSSDAPNIFRQPDLRKLFCIIFFSPGETHRLSLCKAGARFKEVTPERVKARRYEFIGYCDITGAINLAACHPFAFRAGVRSTTCSCLCASCSCERGSARSATGHTDDSYSALLRTVSPTSP